MTETFADMWKPRYALAASLVAFATTAADEGETSSLATSLLPRIFENAPPTEVAADYQKVISAVQQKQALILQAQTERNSTLSALVGSAKEADDLFEQGRGG